ncbi:MAG: hypothetical protein NZ602_14660 [Thermoguttaceae bacterium]|nr:hypothetical protein [Thermoguttaceae bacterium]MDW8036540.1 hypothetical protein [Thermoguttaceae bacterium]
MFLRTTWTFVWALAREVLDWLQPLASDWERPFPMMSSRASGSPETVLFSGILADGGARPRIALTVGLLLAAGRRTVARWLSALGWPKHRSRH